MAATGARARALRVVLVRPRNPLNIGAAARAMANFGLSDLVLVSPYAKAWEEARSARAGIALLRQARTADGIAEAVQGCDWVVGTTAGTGRSPRLPLEDWGSTIASLPATPGALLFGSEKTGLSQQDVSHCHRLARISTSVEAPSMNLGQAVAVCAYEWSRTQAPLPVASAAPLGAVERERILEAWYPLLERLGVVVPAHRDSQMQALRAMLVRWNLEGGDATRLLGIARQVRNAFARLPGGSGRG